MTTKDDLQFIPDDKNQRENLRRLEEWARKKKAETEAAEKKAMALRFMLLGT